MQELLTDKKTSKLIKQGISNLDLVTYVVESPCPECGGEMRAFIEKDKSVPPRCPPICIHRAIDEYGRKSWSGCGYRSFNKRESELTTKLYSDSLKSKTLSIYENGSITATKGVLSKVLKDFIERDEASKQAKEAMKKAVHSILQGDPVHVLLTGKAGTGKTHLAAGAIRDVMERSNYDKKVMFVSYGELYNQMKFAVQDRLLMKKLTQEVIADIKTVDAVVIDDVGAELGKIGSKTLATDYNVSLLQQLVDARVDKATIFTTNLTSKEIQTFYGDRILSRMLSNIRDEKGKMRVISFTDTVDGRLHF